MAIEIVKQSGNKMLVTDGKKFAVIFWDAQAGQVQANGYYAQGRSENAINYVAKWVSKATATKSFRG